MPRPAAEPRRRLTASARRERIESAAVEVFAERGYDATTLGEVSAAASVARTVLYDHFDSKRELFLHVVSVQNAALLREVGAAITSAGPGRERLRTTIAAYLAFAQARPAARRLLVDPVPTGDPVLEQVLAGYRAARTQATAAMLAPDLARTGLAGGSVEAEVVVELLIAGVDGVARWWRDNPRTTLDEVTDAAARLVWNGLPRIAEE